MTEDYKQAALRHWTDACLLEERHKRLENADQLLGMAAECAIKVALVTLPAFSTGGLLSDDYRLHLPVLWNRVQHSSLQKQFPKLYALLRDTDPFSDWDVIQRYAPNGLVAPDRIDKHRTGAKRVLGALGILGSRSS
jgi:hypothetical protein